MEKTVKNLNDLLNAYKAYREDENDAECEVQFVFQPVNYSFTHRCYQVHVFEGIEELAKYYNVKLKENEREKYFISCNTMYFQLKN